MSRIITKPSEAIPQCMEQLDDIVKDEYILFTAAECAQIAKVYGDECAKSAQGYQSNKAAWEFILNSPEWGGKG